MKLTKIVEYTTLYLCKILTIAMVISCIITYKLDIYSLSNELTNNHLGTYTNNTKIITLYLGKMGNINETSIESDSSYFHEKCHYLWFFKLNTTQRLIYTNVFKNTTYFISTYAMKNEREDFAVSCGYKLLCKAYYGGKECTMTNNNQDINITTTLPDIRESIIQDAISAERIWIS